MHPDDSSFTIICGRPPGGIAALAAAFEKVIQEASLSQQLEGIAVPHESKDIIRKSGELFGEH